MNKLLESEVRKRFQEKGWELVGEYIKCRNKVEVICPYCKEIKLITPDHIFSGETKSCGCVSKQFMAEKRSKASREESLGFLYPEVAKLYSKNNKKPIFEIYPQSNKKYLWICEEYGYEHEYISVTSNIVKGSRCPYCSGNKVLEGFNDLAFKNPELISEWHPTKNKLQPTQIAQYSNKKVWWLGKCEHEWDSYVYSRTSQKQSCPYCVGKRILERFNDLAFKNPELASEWHPTKNGDLKSTQYACYSDKNVWWKCNKCNHEWKSTINNRSKGKGCSNCHPISYGVEQIKSFLIKDNIRFEIEKRFETCKNKQCLPFDFYLPDYNLLIEYQGEQHYKPFKRMGGQDKFKQRQMRDKIKVEWTKNNGYDFLVIPYWDQNIIEDILENVLIRR